MATPSVGWTIQRSVNKGSSSNDSEVREGQLDTLTHREGSGRNDQEKVNDGGSGDDHNEEKEEGQRQSPR